MKKNPALGTLVVLAIACLVVWKWKGREEWIWASGALLLVGLGIPFLADWIHRGWMAIGHALGWINGKIVLGTVFFLVLTPLAVLRRLFGKDPLRLRRSKETLWVSRDHDYKSDDFDMAS